MSRDFGHVWRIARLTFLEAVRQRFFNFLMLLSLALIGCAHFFRAFDFKASELKFIVDFGCGGIEFFGSILAVVATAQLFFSEIENRTALTLLAKPVRRWAFIAGKLLGVAMLMLAFVVLMVSILGALLAWREPQIMADYKRQGYDFPPGNAVIYSGLVGYGLLQWLKFCVLSAITILVASFSNTNLYTVVVSFFVLLICQLQYIAHDSWSHVESTVLRSLTWLLGTAFPNFQLFNVGDLLIFPQKHPVPDSALYAAAGYGCFYIAVFGALAVASFRHREI